MDGVFWRDVATLIATQRAANHPLSLGDAHGLALARRLNADVVPADRHEIEQVVTSGLANAIFIR